MLKKRIKKSLKALNFQFATAGFKRALNRLANKDVFWISNTGNFKLIWRIIFAMFFISAIIVGGNVYDKLEASVDSLMGRAETVNYYTQNCAIEPIPGDYNQGWWSAFNAAGRPDLAADSRGLEFNEDNSAFYRGGNYSIACSGFMMDRAQIATNEIQMATNSARIATNTVDIDGESAYFIQISAEERRSPLMGDCGGAERMAASGTRIATSGTRIATNTDETRIATNTDEVTEFQKGAIIPSVEIKSDNQGEGAEVEVLNTEDKEYEVLIKEERENSSSTPDNLISWAGKGIKNLFKMIKARADESGPEADSGYPGVFKSARIKFSYASVFSSQSNDAIKEDILETEIKEQVDDDENIENLPVERCSPLAGDCGGAEGGESTQAPQPFGTIEPLEGTQAPQPFGAIESTEERCSPLAGDYSGAEGGEFTQAPQPFGTMEPSIQEVEIIDAGDEVEVEVNESLDGGGQESVVEIEDEVSVGNDWENFFKIHEARAQGLPHIIVWYSVGTSSRELWQKLGTIERENLSNALNGGYFSYEAPLVENWDDIGNVRIKFEGRSQGQAVFATYLDSVWIEAEYQPAEAGEEEAAVKNKNSLLELLSDKHDFMINENFELEFRYRKLEDSVWRKLGEVAGLVDYWKDVDISAEIADSSGRIIKAPLIIIFDERGRFTVKFGELPDNFKPGGYTIKFAIEDKSPQSVYAFEFEQDFTWGALALNFNKSVYTPNERAELMLAVLDDNGDTICDARIEIEITDPNGYTEHLSTQADTIHFYPGCSLNNYSLRADYYASYPLGAAGDYAVTIAAMTDNGLREFHDRLRVVDSVPFAIERRGPTRINPKYEYSMKLLITPEADYRGEFKESVPDSFLISSSSAYKVGAAAGNRAIVWPVNWQAGQTYSLEYRFDAPDISPHLYEIGPAEMSGFIEARQWQLASDNPGAVGHYFKNYDDVVSYDDLNINYGGWQEVGYYRIASTTFIAGEDYLLVFNFATNASTSEVSSMARIRHGNTEFSDSRFIWQSRRTGEAEIGHGYQYFTVWEAVAGEDINIDLSAYNATSTVRAEGYEAFAINLSHDLTEDSDWHYATSTHSGNLPTSWSSGSEITVDGRDKSWLIIGQGHFLMDHDGADIATRIRNISDGQDYSQLRYEGDSAGDERPALIMIADSFTGSTTWRIQAVVDQSGTHDWDYSKIFALNLSKFRDRHISYQVNGVNITPVDTWVETAGKGSYLVRQTGDTLIWSQEVLDVANNNAAVYSRITIDDTVVPPGHDDAIKGLPHGSSDENAHHNFYLGSLNQGTRDIDIDMKNVAAGVTPAADIHSLIAFSMELKAPPTGGINSLALKRDGSGIVDFSIEVDDPDDDDCRAKIEYAAGAACDFAAPLDPTLGEASTSISADFGEPIIDNLSGYQIGTSSGYIKTASGSNTVLFDWQAKSDLGGAEGIYCVRLTVNDTTDDNDQASPATSTLYIDTLAPTAPGDLSLASKTSESVTLALGATSTETNFFEYKIYYSTSTPVTEDDFVFASSSDPNLGAIDFNEASTTAITGLASSTLYYFAIYAYDQYGNRSSSTNELAVITNFAPDQATSLEQHKSDQSAPVVNGGWAYGDSIILEASVIDSDTLERLNLYFELLPIASAFTTATTVPSGACASTTAYASCTSKIWTATSSLDDYRSAPYTGSVAPSGLPQDYTGYKWQVLACDDYGMCADEWAVFSTTTPNFKTDLTAPAGHGPLSLVDRSTSTVELAFGASTTEAYFREYKIFYSTTTPVTADDYAFASSSDSNLGAIDYSGATSTLVTGLNAGTLYYFSLWAFDQAGNSSSTSELSVLTKGPPGSYFNSAVQRRDGTGRVDISVDIYDEEGDDSRALLEYVSGGACDFSAPLDPALDEADGNITATHGDPEIDNNHAYQIGTSSGLIITAIATNTVEFDWLSAINEPAADGVYCLRLTANDQSDDQFIPATTTLILDNAAPTAPGDLSLYEVKSNSVAVSFGASTTETNFFEYRIYYSTTTPVTEADYIHSSSTDPNLGFQDFNGAGTTTIAGLEINTTYYFSLWAYDAYGHKASSSGTLETDTSYTPKAQTWRWYHDHDNITPTGPAAAENSAPNEIMAGTTLKLRYTIKETAGVAGENIKLRLQYSTFSDFSSDAHFVGEAASSTIWEYADGGGDDNSLITALVLSDASASSTHNESGTTASAYTHASSTAAEWEFTVWNSGAPAATAYYFRAFDRTNNLAIPLNNGASYPSLVTASGQLSYSVAGLEAGTTTEGVTTDVNTAANALNFGPLTSVNSEKVGAHRFTIHTNSGSGYRLFAYGRQALTCGNGAAISPVSGTNETPSGWPAFPDPSAFGYHTGDETLSGASPSRFLPDNTYAQFESSYKEVSYSPIPVINEQVDFIFRIGTSGLQEAGDYETEIVYLLIPAY